MQDVFRQGEHLSRESLRQRLNALPRVALQSIIAGPGIKIMPTGDGICIGTMSEGRKKIPGPDLLRIGKVVELHTGGDKITVYFWDYQTGAYESTTTDVYKPYFLQYSAYNGQTITYTDGSVIAYDATSLNLTYQRRATWNSGTETEIQEITAPYAINEQLLVIQTPDGEFMDLNTAGRHWARAIDQSLA